MPVEEAFGLVAAEALARNLKFFGTKVGGLCDIAAGAEGAELFPLDDPRALKTGIARWLLQGCSQPRCASEEVKRRYHPDVIAARHGHIYREILANEP